MSADLPNHHRLALIGIERAFTERRKAGLGQVNEDLQSTVDAAMGWICDLERELAAIRAALGNGADEAAWRPGASMAEAVGRLRGERAAVVAWLRERADQHRDAGRGQTSFAHGYRAGALAAAADRISNGEHTPAGHEGPHAEALGAENDGEDDGA